MGRRSALTTICRTFMTRIQSSADLYGAVEKFALGTWHSIRGWEILYPGHARRIVALAFMNLVAGWEDFVEACFIRYLAGSLVGWGLPHRFLFTESLCVHFRDLFEFIRSTVKTFAYEFMIG